MTITPITEQELLNLNWERFYGHKELAAQAESGFCKYRLEDPSDPRGWRGCGIGNWMSDEVYHPNFEGTGIRDLLSYHNLKAWLEQCSVGFLMDIQRSHDHYLIDFSPDDYKRRISALAAEYGLVDPTKEIIK